MSNKFKWRMVKEYMNNVYNFYWVTDKTLQSKAAEFKSNNLLPQEWGSIALDRFFEQYLLSKYGEFNGDQIMISPHNLMLVHDGWALGRIITPNFTYDYKENPGKNGIDKTSLSISTLDNTVITDTDKMSSYTYDFIEGSSVKLQARRAAQLVNYMFLTDSEKGSDLLFLLEYQYLKNNKKDNEYDTFIFNTILSNNYFINKNSLYSSKHNYTNFIKEYQLIETYFISKYNTKIKQNVILQKKILKI